MVSPPHRVLVVSLLCVGGGVLDVDRSAHWGWTLGKTGPLGTALRFFCHPTGFNTVVLLKGTPSPPPLPPGLVPPISKPPPGFSSFLPSSHSACVPSPTTTMKA